VGHLCEVDDGNASRRNVHRNECRSVDRYSAGSARDLHERAAPAEGSGSNGAPASHQQAAPDPVIVVQVQLNGNLRISQEPVSGNDLPGRWAACFKERAKKVAFIRGEAPVEFALVVRVVDVLHGSGISVGLLTPGLEQTH
jgi:hypothetical protein